MCQPVVWHAAHYVLLVSMPSRLASKPNLALLLIIVAIPIAYSREHTQAIRKEETGCPNCAATACICADTCTCADGCKCSMCPGTARL